MYDHVQATDALGTDRDATERFVQYAAQSCIDSIRLHTADNFALQ